MTIMYWEIVQIVFQLLFGLSLLLLGVILFVKKKKSAKQKNCPSLQYFKLRFHVKSWLKTKRNDGKTQIDEILLILRLVRIQRDF